MDWRWELVATLLRATLLRAMLLRGSALKAFIKLGNEIESLQSLTSQSRLTLRRVERVRRRATAFSGDGGASGGGREETGSFRCAVLHRRLAHVEYRALTHLTLFCLEREMVE